MRAAAAARPLDPSVAIMSALGLAFASGKLRPFDRDAGDRLAGELLESGAHEIPDDETDDEPERADCFFCGTPDVATEAVSFDMFVDDGSEEHDWLERSPHLDALDVCDDCLDNRSIADLMRVAASRAIAPATQLLDDNSTKPLEASDACDALDACAHASFVEVSMVGHDNAAVCLDCGARRIGTQWKAPRLVALACDSARSLRAKS